MIRSMFCNFFTSMRVYSAGNPRPNSTRRLTPREHASAAARITLSWCSCRSITHTVVGFVWCQTAHQSRCEHHTPELVLVRISRFVDGESTPCLIRVNRGKTRFDHQQSKHANTAVFSTRRLPLPIIYFPAGTLTLHDLPANPTSERALSLVVTTACSCPGATASPCRTNKRKEERQGQSFIRTWERFVATPRTRVRSDA